MLEYTSEATHISVRPAYAGEAVVVHESSLSHKLSLKVRETLGEDRGGASFCSLLAYLEGCSRAMLKTCVYLSRGSEVVPTYRQEREPPRLK